MRSCDTTDCRNLIDNSRRYCSRCRPGWTADEHAAALDAARNAARALYAAQADGHPDGTHTLTTTEQGGAAA